MSRGNEWGEGSTLERWMRLGAMWAWLPDLGAKGASKGFNIDMFLMTKDASCESQ